MKKQVLILSAIALSIASYSNAANAPTGTTTQNAMKSAPQNASSTLNSNQTLPGKAIDQTIGTPETSGVSAPADRFSTPDDQRLGMEVRALIIEAVGPDQSKNIYLFIDKGDVQLSGKAVSEEKKRAIVDAIKNDKNVKSVTSKLTTNTGTAKPY